MQPCGICLEATNCQETICCKQPICAACHDQWTLHSKRQSCAFCRVCSNPLVVKLGDHKYIVSGSEQTGQTIFLNAISADVSVTSLSVRFEDNKVRVEWMEKVDAELYLHRARNFRLEDNGLVAAQSLWMLTPWCRNSKSGDRIRHRCRCSCWYGL